MADFLTGYLIKFQFELSKKLKYNNTVSIFISVINQLDARKTKFCASSCLITQTNVLNIMDDILSYVKMEVLWDVK